MTANHAVYTSDYLLSTQSVLHAGGRLRNVLDADRATREYAITRLERAAEQHETGGTGYRTFMFSELETTTEADKAIRERVTEDVLISVLTDLQVANVLMAAGQALGETGEKAEPRRLDEALLRLENTTRAVERSLPSPLAIGAEPGRFGFAEAVTIPAVVQSADLPSAIETFRHRSNETLSTLVNEARGVVASVITVLSQLDEEKVLAGLSKLGVQVQELPRIGRLFRWGVEKLEGAIDALIGLLGSEALARIKAQVEKVWQDVKEGKYVAQALEWAFGVEATRTDIEEILRSEGLRQEALDKAGNALDQLASAFKENMSITRGLTSAVTFGCTLLTPLASPQLALVAASAYAVILAAVVLIGMDYADSGRILQRVRGVREIASSVRPA